MPPINNEAEAEITIQDSVQVSPEIEPPSDPQPSSQDSASLPLKYANAPPPLLPIIETMLNKFYLVGESVDKIHDYVDDQGAFYNKIFLQRILGTYRDPPTIRHSYKFPTTSAGLVSSEAEAQKRVDERMRLFRFILDSAKEGKTLGTIERLCVREGYELPGHFLEELVMHGKRKPDPPYPRWHCLHPPEPGSYWWGGC